MKVTIAETCRDIELSRLEGIFERFYLKEGFLQVWVEAQLEILRKGDRSCLKILFLSDCVLQMPCVGEILAFGRCR
ncbi:hypothetical protein [Nostoc sp.]|uniref:hypothetical protein n=1 Tax=Nostoc sp. TaxID=1180 RepID=UPI002FFADAAE